MVITTKGKNALKLMVGLSLYQGQEFVRLKEQKEKIYQKKI